MKKYILIIIILITNNCYAQDQDIIARRQIKEPEVVSISNYDIDSDGNLETLEIIIEKGEWLLESIMYFCGGGRKWAGNFSIRTRKDEEVLHSYNLNKMFFHDDAEMFFWSSDSIFSVHFEDYNRDGQIDFNIGQYGSCSWNCYKLYTISSTGEISELPIDDNAGGDFCVAPQNHTNTTGSINLEDNDKVSYYFFPQGGQGYFYRYTYRWDGNKFVFVSSKRGEKL